MFHRSSLPPSSRSQALENYRRHQAAVSQRHPGSIHRGYKKQRGQKRSQHQHASRKAQNHPPVEPWGRCLKHPGQDRLQPTEVDHSQCSGSGQAQTRSGRPSVETPEQAARKREYRRQHHDPPG